MNWLERAHREIGGTSPGSTANSADRNPTAVMAVLPVPAAASIGSNGSTPSSRIPEIEAAAEVSAVVRLRLVLQQDDGQRVEAILAIPRARYDGLRVLELFERHRMAGTTRVIEVHELEGES